MLLNTGTINNKLSDETGGIGGRLKYAEATIVNNLVCQYIYGIILNITNPDFICVNGKAKMCDVLHDFLYIFCLKNRSI